MGYHYSHHSLKTLYKRYKGEPEIGGETSASSA